MAPQLPTPEKFTEALAGALSFPPKLSAIAELLAEPERIFEEQAAAMGLPVPTGPMRTLAQTLSGIEATLPTLTLPVPTAPTTPTTPPAGVSLGETEKVEVSQPKPTPTTRARERIEIIEV
ncbi:MAG: hypothetical protein J7K15_01735 [Deltaproteobacteria bacterium]|nr:hypothetical protein [Deltaproteobacteria bacterium]